MVLTTMPSATPTDCPAPAENVPTIADIRRTTNCKGMVNTSASKTHNAKIPAMRAPSPCVRVHASSITAGRSVAAMAMTRDKRHSTAMTATASAPSKTA
jgi:hypothetical protein